MKNKEKISFKEAFKINNRAMSVWYKNYPELIISFYIHTIWEAITPYAGIYLSALILEELSTTRNPETLRNLVIITLFASALIALITAFIEKWCLPHMNGLFFKIRRIFGEKLLDMDFVHIDDTKTHEMLSQIYQSQSSNAWGLYKVIFMYEELISGFFTLLGGIVLTVTLFTSKVPESASNYVILNNPLFILLIIALMLIVTIIAPTLQNKSLSYMAKSIGNLNFANRMFGHVSDLAFSKKTATDARIYRQDLFVKKHIADKENSFSSKGIVSKYARGPMGFFSAASAAVSVVFTGIAYLFVGLKAWAGAFGVGMVTQYVASITKVAGGISNMVSFAGNMKNNAPHLELVFEFLDKPNIMYQGSLTVEKRRDRDYEVEFRDVSFKYPGSETFALSHVNMKFKIGERLAVVGMNGSGKTTFIKLLCRLYDPTEGVILLNGIDIRKYNYLDYMMVFSIVFQDFKLFSLKLGETVAAGSDVNEELAIDCLKKAGFGERLAEMPNGINTYLYKDYDESGVDISGGEAQKIAIARAIYKNSPFIILDEPTAALDPIAEAEIYSKFNDIAGDKTAIYISHRLSSCKFCDEIAVFDHGTVIQKGTHNNLLEDTNGKYYELWNAQAQYYTKQEQE